MKQNLEVVNPLPKREAVLFVRIQQINKDWLDKNGMAEGFSDTATYVDTIVTALRLGQLNGNGKRKIHR